MRVRWGQVKGAPAKRGKEERSRGGRQVLQLTVCVVLFLTVFIGKGAFPERVAQVGPQLLGVIRSNTDFRAAFARLGSAVADNDSLPDGLKEFCVAVFGPRSEVVPTDEPEEVLQSEPLVLEEPAPSPPEEVQPVEQPPAYQIGDVVETVVVEGQQLPEHYTYDRLYLGRLETADPVEGKLTSAFGYRDHPTIGRYAVHGGVDVGAPMGAAVAAFADGVVEYVGESADFGLYLRLSHANGVSTFYSHCQSIEVEKGERVTAGQPVARVGSTGKSTGPHLHFEIQLGQTRLDPMHYITLQEG